MKKIRNLSRSRPALFCFLLAGFTTVCSLASAKIFTFFPWTLTTYFTSTVVGILWPLALTLVLGYGYIFRTGSFGATLVPGLPCLFLRLYLMTAYISQFFTEETPWVSLPVMLTGVLYLFGIGFWEEMIFRGVIGNTLAVKYATNTKGMWLTVILSAAIFSAIHLQSLLHGLPLDAMAAQLVGAFGLGMVLAAVYLRGGNLWVLVLLHTIVDVPGLFQSTFIISSGTGSVIDAISELDLSSILGLLPVHIALTLFLLRKSKQPAIFARLEQLRSEISC